MGGENGAPKERERERESYCLNIGAKSLRFLLMKCSSSLGRAPFVEKQPLGAKVGLEEARGGNNNTSQDVN